MSIITRVPTGYDTLTGEVKAWDYHEELNIEIKKTMKVLVATEKPFAKKAVDGIRSIVEEAGYELALLEKYTDKTQLLEAVADVDALIVRSDKVTREVIDAARNLRIVVRAGAGYDNVDLAAATERGIVVMNTPGQNSNAVAELAIALMIFMARNRFTPGTGSEIQGKTLGIHAYGHVGRRVGRKGKALGMEVIAYDPFVGEEVFAADGVKRVGSIAELYASSDYLSLHIPATAETKGSIGYDLLMSMPKGATLVNTARKEVIDEEGVLRALTEREDLKYVTDIAAGNQAELDEKFGKRVFATPKKMGAETAEANINAGLAAARQIVDFFRTGNPRFQVNKYRTGTAERGGWRFRPASFRFCRTRTNQPRALNNRKTYGTHQTFPWNTSSEGACLRSGVASLRRAELRRGES